MGFRAWMHQLISDAKAVWGAPGANRPLTRRWLIDREIANRNKQASRKNEASTKVDHGDPKKAQDNVEG